MSAIWQDPTYESGQEAFYYARVLGNPTCRWSSWDGYALLRLPLRVEKDNTGVSAEPAELGKLKDKLTYYSDAPFTEFQNINRESVAN